MNFRHLSKCHWSFVFNCNDDVKHNVKQLNSCQTTEDIFDWTSAINHRFVFICRNEIRRISAVINERTDRLLSSPGSTFSDMFLAVAIVILSHGVRSRFESVLIRSGWQQRATKRRRSSTIARHSPMRIVVCLSFSSRESLASSFLLTIYSNNNVKHAVLFQWSINSVCFSANEIIFSASEAHWQIVLLISMREMIVLFSLSASSCC